MFIIHQCLCELEKGFTNYLTCRFDPCFPFLYFNSNNKNKTKTETKTKTKTKKKKKRTVVFSANAATPGAGIMEADDRQVTTVFTVQPSFHHRHSTNRVS